MAVEHRINGRQIVMSDQARPADEMKPGTDESSAPSAVHRDRRALMLGAAAAGAGVAASLAGGGLAEAAPDAGGAVQLGKSNSAKATTQVITKAGDGLKGQTSATNHSGIVGSDTSSGTGGHGVYGNSVHGDGVLGVSAHKTGVVGQGSTAGQSGVAGIDASTKTGGHGVFGQSQHGDAVFATSLNGVALRGESARPGPERAGQGQVRAQRYGHGAQRPQDRPRQRARDDLVEYSAGHDSEPSGRHLDRRCDRWLRRVHGRAVGQRRDRRQGRLDGSRLAARRSSFAGRVARFRRRVTRFRAQAQRHMT
jgi:hypothetical protein